VPARVYNQASGKNLEKSRRLLQALVPRAECFCFYDDQRSCAWSSEGAEDFEIDAFVRNLPEDAFGAADRDTDYVRRTLQSGRTMLALPVRRDNNEFLGTLVVGFSRNAGKSSWFNPSMLHGVLAPAVALIGENLEYSESVGALGREVASCEAELDFVYEVDEQVHTNPRSNSGLAQLVGKSGRYLDVCYSVLLIPSKRIRISATHSTWKNVNRRVLDRYLVEQILPRVDGQRKPVVFEMPADEVGTAAVRDGYQTLVCPIMDRNGNSEGLLAQLGRINKRPFNKRHKRLMASVVRKAEYIVEQSFDSMTGLMNRPGFEAQLHESWRSLNDPDAMHQILYLDLDNLQLINDSFGRSAGDSVIVRFARLLEENLPKSAVLSRLTGDDFCILLTHASDEDALALAQDIRKRSEALRYLEGDRSLQVTISVGIAAFTRQTGDETKALTSARMACDSAKDHGRDRIEVYDDDNQSIIRRHDDMQLVADIQQSLDSDGFELLAQPIAPLHGADGRVRYEVLLRMQDRDGNRVPSRAFFSAAERYQMMPQIDRWVVSKTLAALSRHFAVVEARSALFSINLSGQSLGDDDLLSFIEDEIRAAAVPVTAIGFELTESAAVSNLVKAQAIINALHDRGCRISLDDFGAGLSSFAYLKNFEVDTLKIDGSFIRDITDNRISESMVAAITQVAKVMELDTVAEYVEQDKTRRLLTKLGVDYAQGHAIGWPQPLEEVLEDLGQLAESFA
jgi:diguanylate cyclase (GGDEF)-like protein